MNVSDVMSDKYDKLVSVSEKNAEIYLSLINSVTDPKQSGKSKIR